MRVNIRENEIERKQTREKERATKRENEIKNDQERTRLRVNKRERMRLRKIRKERD